MTNKNCYSWLEKLSIKIRVVKFEQLNLRGKKHGQKINSQWKLLRWKTLFLRQQGKVRVWQQFYVRHAFSEIFYWKDNLSDILARISKMSPKYAFLVIFKVYFRNHQYFFVIQKVISNFRLNEWKFNWPGKSQHIGKGIILFYFVNHPSMGFVILKVLV